MSQDEMNVPASGDTSIVKVERRAATPIAELFFLCSAARGHTLRPLDK